MNLKKLKNNNKAIAGAIGGIIAILVLVIVGMIVYYKVAGSVNGLPASGVLAAASVNSTADTIFSLAPIIAIVMVAGMILLVVMGFGRTSGGGA